MDFSWPTLIRSIDVRHLVAAPGIDLSVEVIGLDVGGDLCLPLVAVVQQLLLVVEQLLVGLR